ncbi:polysaccharide pyruvyl transferase family protein [Butyrivibrio sp. AE3004]|uniref:polysaccharide pyruvyl transferase family protein n=1 Tax=Butyrivibrio sp. AE3004 TaxID=1506994 RepID=UPI000494D1E7|nr:polysaccharide pyruvyl transferase family protein [Butyrivibrio sp. AE3004]
MSKKGKAAILTWCYNNGKTNYGQILQCYAMQEIVKKCGYEPIVIRYRKPTPDENVLFRNSSERLQYERDYRIRVIEGGESTRISRFMEFIRSNIKLSDQCYTTSEIADVTKNCELLVCGSDQIWNPLWFDEVYCLNFARLDQRKIAYAPSGVFDETRSESIDVYRRIGALIRDFDFVAVRESKSASILQRFSSKKIGVAIDPTMLLTADEWNNVAGKRICEEKYVFCYSLGRMRPHKLLMHYLMKKYHAEKILFITSGHYDEEDELETEGVFHTVDDAGPGEFISLIRGAEAVCTDSFHGIALSIIYEKQFYMIKRKDPDIELWGSAERQRNLLQKVGINDDRTIRSIKEIDEMADIKYDEVAAYRNEPSILLI